MVAVNKMVVESKVGNSLSPGKKMRYYDNVKISVEFFFINQVVVSRGALAVLPAFIALSYESTVTMIC